MTNTSTNSITFSDDDVVCGRGKGFELLPSNQKFRLMIKQHASAYSRDKISRTGKSQLIKTIFDEIQAEEMRFVKRCKQEGDWKVLDESEIKLKIGHALRDIDTVRQKADRRKLHRMQRKCEIKQGMQDDLERAIGLTEVTNESIQSMEEVRRVAITKSRAFEFAQISLDDNQTHEPCAGDSSGDLEPLPLEANADHIENLKVTMNENGIRPSSLHDNLISAFCTDIAASEGCPPLSSECGEELALLDSSPAAHDEENYADFGVALSQLILEHV